MNDNKYEENSIISYISQEERAVQIVETLDNIYNIKNNSIFFYLADLNQIDNFQLVRKVAEIYAQKLTKPQLIGLSDFLKELGSLITSKAESEKKRLFDR